MVPFDSVYLAVYHKYIIFSGVVSAPLWNSSESKFAGMLTVLDIIHLIQYYYKTATYDTVVTEAESFRLESLRGVLLHDRLQDIFT
jgi:hypothetical protein